MGYRDIWKTRAYFEDMDAENAAHMIPLNTKDRGMPFKPVGPPQGVKRGATWPGCSDFIWRSMERCRRLT